MTCTIFENIYGKVPNHKSIQVALARIKDGKSKDRVMEIRAALDKEKANELKKNLPSVCFSGKFNERVDNKIIEHSGFLVLDFDNVEDMDVRGAELANEPFVHAIWVSPSGNGLKCLVRVADGSKHREHFNALKEKYPDVDASGVNESRVCYESYDPHIYINDKSVPFTKTTEFTKYETTKPIEDENVVFKNLLKWQSNKGGAFVKGERNIFIFKMAGACCRYGISEDSATSLILTEFPASNEFTTKEAVGTIKSAFKRNSSAAGTVTFDRGILVDKTTRKEIEVSATPHQYDPSEPGQDIIYAASVKKNIMDIYFNGYTKVSGIGVPKVDYLFKSKRGEVTGTTGIGNYGKSTWYKWYKTLRILLYNEKYVVFGPEDNPAEEFYLDFAEILLGKNCTPTNFDGSVNLDRPSESVVSNAVDFIGQHIFYLYPQDRQATLEYIFERFLEMIIKEKVDGCIIDPWNQVIHDYNKHGSNVSKYLEYQLGEIGRFSQVNNVFMDIILHPKSMQKNGTGNYDCPDKFDLNDGAMWNNKLENLLVYHRPFFQTDPRNPTCEIHSKKIKRQKVVGKIGFMQCEYLAGKRRFEVDGYDPIYDAIQRNKLDFSKPIVDFKPVPFNLPTPDNPQAGITTFGGSKLFIPGGYKPNPTDFSEPNKKDEDAPF